MEIVIWLPQILILFDGLRVSAGLEIYFIDTFLSFRGQ